MRQTKCICICDICNQEDEKIESIDFPIKESDCEGRMYFDVIGKIDICNECKEKYMGFIYKNFGIVRDSLGELSFEPTKIRF